MPKMEITEKAPLMFTAEPFRERNKKREEKENIQIRKGNGLRLPYPFIWIA